MNKLVLLAVLCSSAFAQTPDTLQSLLREVHQLRQAIEGITVASQRVQIALYTLQVQDAAVARAGQRADAAHSKCSGLEDRRRQIASDVQRFETGIAAPGSTPKAELDEMKNHASGLKSLLEEQTTQLQTCQATEAEVASQLRAEQGKLTESQDRIARLDIALAQLAGQAK